MVWTANTLYWHIEAFFGIRCNVNSFQIFQQRLSGIPRNVFRMGGNIVALCCRKRNNRDVFQSQFLLQGINLCNDFVETRFAIFYQVHLVYSKDKVPNTHQFADSCMTSGLHQNALRSVNQNDCQIRKRCTNCHVSGIFFMTWCVCNDKAAVVGCKIPICNVNRNTLFPFCHQAIQQQ